MGWVGWEVGEGIGGGNGGGDVNEKGCDGASDADNTLFVSTVNQ